MLQGDFSMTNVEELHEKLMARGQHPVFDNNTQAILEEVGYHLDEAHTDKYRELRKKNVDGREIPQIISAELNLFDVIEKSCKDWDGGYVIMGAVGNGDFFCLRDPNGIRHCYYIQTKAREHDENFLAGTKPDIFHLGIANGQNTVFGV